MGYGQMGLSLASRVCRDLLSFCAAHPKVNLVLGIPSRTGAVGRPASELRGDGPAWCLAWSAASPASRRMRQPHRSRSVFGTGSCRSVVRRLTGPGGVPSSSHPGAGGRQRQPAGVFSPEGSAARSARHSGPPSRLAGGASGCPAAAGRRGDLRP